MSLDEPFLRAIAADPDDDVPRLIYADWLEERGDPRSEFIRLQCELAQLPAHQRPPNLTARESELQSRYSRGWDTALRGEDVHLVPREYQRGFLHEVAMHLVTAVKQSAMLFQAAPTVRSLCIYSIETIEEARQLVETGCVARLWEFRVESIEPAALGVLLDSGQFSSLRSLSVELTWDNGAIERLARCGALHGLETLELKHVRLGSHDIEAILSSPHLTKLKALDISLASAAAAHRLAQLPEAGKLEKLDIWGPDEDVGDSPMDDAESAIVALAGSRHWASLQELSVFSIPCGDDVAHALARHQSLENLRDLYLSDACMSDQGMAAMSRSHALAQLETLGLPRMGDEGAVAVARSPRWKRLRVLSLGGERLTSVGAKELAAARHLTSLRTLSLGRSRIGPSGLFSLAYSDYLEGLDRLYLMDSDIGDEGLVRLARSPVFKNLGALWASGCQIGDRGAAALAEVPEGRLQSLVLGSNRITDQGAALLASAECLSKLLYLNMSGCDLSVVGAESLLNSPKFRVESASFASSSFSAADRKALRAKYAGRLYP